MKQGWPLAFLACALLGACASTTRAPVVDRAPVALGSSSGAPVKPAPTVKPAAAAASEARAETYTVRRGDTLYAIALDNGLDYRELAEWNALADPNLIREGQVLRLTSPAAVQVKPVVAAGSVTAKPLGNAAPSDGIKTEPRAVRLPYSEENLALLSKPAAKPPAADPPEACSRCDGCQT